MEWSDEGIVLTLRPHGESSGILEALMRNHGRHLGLVRGGSSSPLSLLGPLLFLIVIAVLSGGGRRGGYRRGGVMIFPGELFGDDSGKYVRISYLQPLPRIREAVDRMGRFMGGLK